MGMMINRRRVCGGKTPYLPDYTLIHYWEASDGVVNGYWVDRASGMQLQAYGNPQVVDDMFKLRFNDVYFTKDLNTSPVMNLGDVWQIDIEFKVDNVPTGSSSQSSWLVDFGSLENSWHAFGFCVTQNNTTIFNPKLTGNGSNSLYDVAISFSTYGILSQASMGMEKIDNNLYLPYYILNDIRYNSPNTTTAQGATFNGNFNQSILYVGRGTTTNTMHQTYDWRYIKSIKIYKKNTV